MWLFLTTPLQLTLSAPSGCDDNALSCLVNTILCCHSSIYQIVMIEAEVLNVLKSLNKKSIIDSKLSFQNGAVKS